MTTEEDPRDPATADAVAAGRDFAANWPRFLDRDGLRGARIGIPRAGVHDSVTEEVTRAFDAAVAAIQGAGATVVDPAEIPTIDQINRAFEELVVGDIPVPRAAENMGELMRRLQQAGIERIVIDRGVQVSELMQLVQTVARVEPGKDPTAALGKLPGVRPVLFVGQGKRAGQEGMTQREQSQVLDRFRAGEHNVLVATSVAEEGLLDPREVVLRECGDAVKELRAGVVVKILRWDPPRAARESTANVLLERRPECRVVEVDVDLARASH